ncbi:predicted protein [Naegleria gruberi]|uniref:Predicted protein n=1 Tax=Naegleria gruberi TaxID=5762 RepID=D2V5J1_NAEGR|nr:uncharacterized protein NAEGRDRAFT_64096 [Naegleria gruberi]EFC47660.1 predicted protein [Naegleria gruberi]|eukprot:XP_002680404.1 predicted protein [Naegleria gruberi strain NEG-M]
MAILRYIVVHTRWTALFASVFSKQKSSVEILLKLGANPNIPSDKGETPLQFARKQKLDDLAELLSKNTSSSAILIDDDNTTLSNPSLPPSNSNSTNISVVSNSSSLSSAQHVNNNNNNNISNSTSMITNNNNSNHNNSSVVSSNTVQHAEEEGKQNNDEENIWDIINEGIKLSEDLDEKLNGLSLSDKKSRVEEEELLLSPLVFESESLQVISFRYPDHFTHKFGDLDYTTRMLTIHFVLESTLLTEHLISKLQGKFNVGNEFKLVENQVPTRKISIKYQVSKEVDLNTLKTSITDIHSKIGNDIKPLRYLLLIFSKNKKVVNLEETTIDL